MPRPIRATISVSALAHNLELARRHAGAAKIWAVVKANAYGHGLARAARALGGADGYALLDIEEAVRLRSAGMTRPILLLEGFFDASDMPLVCRHGLTPVIHCMEQLAILEAAPPEGPIDVYLKVNSGMNRLGFTAASAPRAWQALHRHPRVRSITWMTHFADADGAEGVAGQLERFGAMTRALEAPHCLANSAALLRYPQTRGDWVRPGIMLYGCSPFPDQNAADLGLRPAMTLRSEIIGVQRLQPGERVGYGFDYEARTAITVGVVACGYGDGYPRHAPTGTPVLIAGRRASTAGRVSMDLLCVDISGIPDAGAGTPVTLWGEGLSADEVAAAAGTVSYQLLCALAARVPVSEIA
ncbi:MAG: alanine racemase [Betaproteobacteria bacterium]|nr:MAG: alanine racemase [Betaproteobacteria bacterium]